MLVAVISVVTSSTEIQCPGHGGLSPLLHRLRVLDFPRGVPQRTKAMTIKLALHSFPLA